MLLHYLGVALVPFFDEFAEWKYFERVWEAYPLVVLVGGSLYLVGQIVIWFCWLGNETRKSNKVIGTELNANDELSRSTASLCSWSSIRSDLRTAKTGVH